VTSRDALFGGRLVLAQPARGQGYRVNVDALLLAAFAARGHRARLAVDLGAGSGAVGLSLLYFDAADRVVFVEIDALASEAARANLEANGWKDRGVVLSCDARVVPQETGADLVVCNPPYMAPGRGRPPKRPETARARSGELSLFTRAARGAMGRRARACFVYPAGEVVALWSALRETGLEPKRARAVHADATTPARIVLVEARPAKPGGLTIEPPLVERDARGYAGELRSLLAGTLTTSPPRAGRGRSRTPPAR
jgi:tRNA1Val (adenine37-N6)-methyltransferase